MILKRMLFVPLAVIAAWLMGSLTAQAETREMKMTIDEVTIQVAPDLKFSVFAFNGQVPGPLIHVKEGDDLIVHVTNNTTLPHTVHWHGIHQMENWHNDGVPGITQEAPGIKPGETFTYKFKADRPGSLWYHCHVNVNEHVSIRGMWGPLIVDPAKPTALEKTVTKDFIMMFSTWESAHAAKFGEGGTPYDTQDYFTMNGRAFPYTQPMRFKSGDVIRVRFYGAGDEIHNLHSHGHDMTITHKDGLPLASPYMVDTVSVGPGERYDVIYTANHKDGRFIFHDHVDTHLTNHGKHPGGPITVMEYAGTPMDPWYMWKDIKYNPDFFFTESMKKYGLIEQPAFKGQGTTQARGQRHN